MAADEMRGQKKEMLQITDQLRCLHTKEKNTKWQKSGGR